MLCFGEVTNLVCNVYLNVAACIIVSADPLLDSLYMLLGR